MSDYMLLEYLRNKGMRGDDEQLIRDFKKYMRTRGGSRSFMKHSDYDDMDYNRHDWDFEDSHRDRYAKSNEGSFSEYEAKEIVSEMYHYETNRRHIGEHFSMKKAEEVYNKHKDSFVIKASPYDVYVAINATYHDFCGILKSWFGANIDEKTILLAVAFWFKDDDYQGNKLMDYFM